MGPVTERVTTGRRRPVVALAGRGTGRAAAGCRWEHRAPRSRLGPTVPSSQADPPGPGPASWLGLYIRGASGAAELPAPVPRGEMVVQELKLCQGIVDATLRRAKGRRVGAVRLRVAGDRVDAAAIERGFRLLSAGSAAEGASVEVRTDRSPLYCEDCGAHVHPAEGLPRQGSVVAALVVCPSCQSLVTQWALRDGAVLESVTFAPGPGSLCLVPPA